MSNNYREELSSKLRQRFQQDSEVVSDVVQQVIEARNFEYTRHLNLDDPDKVVSGIDNWAQGQGLTAGWNRWIGVGVPEEDTTHLTV